MTEPATPTTAQPEPPDEQAALAEVIRNGGLISDDARFALTQGIHNGGLTDLQLTLLTNLIHYVDATARYDRCETSTPLRGAYRALLGAMAPDVTP